MPFIVTWFSHDLYLDDAKIKAENTVAILLYTRSQSRSCAFLQKGKFVHRESNPVRTSWSSLSSPSSFPRSILWFLCSPPSKHSGVALAAPLSVPANNLAAASWTVFLPPYSAPETALRARFQRLPPCPEAGIETGGRLLVVKLAAFRVIGS